jgi:uncharacterized protein YxeA
MKKTVIVFLVLLAVASIGFFACDDILDAEERGKKAAEEACECLKKKSESACTKEFEKKYGDETSEEFINAFNKEGSKCGAKAYLKK